MYLKPIKPGVKPAGPPGCNPLCNEDRRPILKVTSGDTCRISTRLTAENGSPADPDNSRVEFVLSENQFSPPLWTGTWLSGVMPDRNVRGLAHVDIPQDIMSALRRGSYMFSIRVSDPLRSSFDTQLEGYLLVEYAPTSDQHSIPYRDGTSEIFGGGGKEEDQTPSTISAYDPATHKWHKIFATTNELGEKTLVVAQVGSK